MTRMTCLRRRGADQAGFTLINVMFTMMALGAIVVASWALATGDIPVARADQDHKRAYEAAQAGLQWYAYQLDRDPNYWTKCASVAPIGTDPAPVNLEWNGSGGDPRIWRDVPGSTGGDAEEYTIEIMRKRDSAGNPTTQCSASNAVGTALQNNTLRIRSTGRANGETRSLVATFKRRSFMDFVYFTSSEAQDPLVGGGTTSGCIKQRSAPRSGCTEITFVNPDQVKGPLHTNDSSVLVTGSPVTFGRSGKNDAFEVAGPRPGYVGTGSPTFKGPTTFNASTLDPPPGNGSLKTLATPAWTFTGSTCLVFKSDATVDVYPNRDWKTSGRVTCTGGATNKPLTGSSAPPNGVIYVQNSTTVACDGTYDKFQRYQNSTSCGDVAVSGTYSADVTVASENDIIVNQNLQQLDGSDSMLGLVANGFVRVYHPIQGETSTSCGSTNATPAGFVRVSRIDAAILSLSHSFMVDNYDCAGAEGTLTVNGAIAQLFRGVVGTGNGSTGYIKDYNYDDRLKVREPPNFLDPKQTSWRIVTQFEQKPPTT